MKKLLPFILLVAACKTNSHDGKYVNLTKGQFSVTDDTLEVRDSVLIQHTGFQRIHNGITLPKEYKTKQLYELRPQFENGKLILNNTTYEKL